MILEEIIVRAMEGGVGRRREGWGRGGRGGRRRERWNEGWGRGGRGGRRDGVEEGGVGRRKEGEKQR